MAQVSVAMEEIESQAAAAVAAGAKVGDEAAPAVTETKPPVAATEAIAEKPAVESGGAATKTEGTKAEAAAEEEVVYVKEVIVDGQPMSFEGKTPEEIEGKILAAFSEAVKKSKTPPAAASAAPEKKAAALTADEEFALDQEFGTKPTAALRKVFEKMFGVSVDEFRELADDVQARKLERAAREATDQFLKSTPDFVPNLHNGTLIKNYLGTMGKLATVENITEAYTTLKGANLFTDKRDAPAAATGSPAAAEPKKKTAPSGLFGRTGAPTTRTKTGPSDEDVAKKISKMSSTEAADYLAGLAEQQS